MEDRNQPVPRDCPRCGLTAKLMPTLGDYKEYDCMRCGPYRISGSTRQEIIKGVVDPNHSRLVKRKGHRWLVK